MRTANFHSPNRKPDDYDIEGDFSRQYCAKDKSKGISKNLKDFDEWIAVAKDRSKWRQLTHSIPKPPDAWRLKDTSGENDYNIQFHYAKGHSAQSDLS